MGERRTVLVCLLTISAAFCLTTSCAEKTPPPKTAAAAPAAAAPVAAAAAVPSGPPVELIPAANARPHLLASISVGSLNRLLENGTRLVGQAVPLPMDANGIRDMLLTQAGLPPEVAANLDFASPAGAAFVAIGDKGESGTVLAVPAKGAAEAQRIIDALGKPVMVRGQVVLVRSATSGSGWLYRAGNVVVLSDELEALSRGAMLALEARRPGADDITADIFPEALARAHGTDVKSAIAHLMEEMRKQQGAAAAGALNERTMQPVAELLGLIGDAASAQVGLSADPARGLVLRARLLARPGTRLETVAREVHPFALDASVIGEKASRILVGASSIGPFWRGLFDTYRARLAADKGKGAAAALAYLDATLAAMGGETSGAMWVRKEVPYLSGAFASPIKDTASAAKLASSLGTMDTNAVSAFLRAQVGDQKMFDWTAKKETVGKVKALHYRIKWKKTGVDTESTRKFLGDELDLYWAVAGTRIVFTLGRDAKTRLVALATGKPAADAPAGTLAEAMGAAKGRDTFYYMDLAPLVALAGKLSDEPRMQSLARSGGAPIPVVVTAGGDGAGKMWTTDLTVTVAAFSSIGALVAGGIGAAR
jgi:hypothetical protein